jgi:DsbC/DsbD-like thiol-disulfide interchange protein
MFDRRALLSFLALAGTGAPVLAAPAVSAWSRDSKSAVRLLDGGMEGGVHLAGVEITLDPGTKTYWRTPGDSGVPPAFDWSKSSNVADVAVSWPAPLRFPDGNGFSIGYKAGVVFPLLVKPKVTGQPVRLGLHLDYAVCDQICIPAKADAWLGLSRSPSDPAAAAAIARFRATVPQASAAGLSLVIDGVDKVGQWPVVMLKAQVDAGQPADLFAEGPDAHWTLPLPEPVDSAGAIRRFKLTLDGAPRGTDPLGHALTFTLVSGNRALEAKLTPR